MIMYCCVDCMLHVSVLYLYYASEIKQETKIEIYKAIRVTHSCAYLYYKGGGGGWGGGGGGGGGQLQFLKFFTTTRQLLNTPYNIRNF